MNEAPTTPKARYSLAKKDSETLFAHLINSSKAVATFNSADGIELKEIKGKERTMYQLVIPGGVFFVNNTHSVKPGNYARVCVELTTRSGQNGTILTLGEVVAVFAE